MNVYDILQEGLRGEGSEKMWCITKLLSDCIETCVSEEHKKNLFTKIYYIVNGGHFDKKFADESISKFYYTDNRGIKHTAPYWTESEVKPLYESVRIKIPYYNFYDFMVTLNMVKSDNYNKLKSWFEDATEDELLEKMVEEVVNYLDDEDNPYGTEKIWKYLHS